jgi:hypothetical protein
MLLLESYMGNATFGRLSTFTEDRHPETRMPRKIVVVNMVRMLFIAELAFSEAQEMPSSLSPGFHKSLL